MNIYIYIYRTQRVKPRRCGWKQPQRMCCWLDKKLPKWPQIAFYGWELAIKYVGWMHGVLRGVRICWWLGGWVSELAGVKVVCAWVLGYVGAWVRSCEHAWSGAWVCGCVGECVYWCMGAWIVWVGWWMVRRVCGCVCAWMDWCLGDWVGGWVSGWIAGWASGRLDHYCGRWIRVTWLKHLWRDAHV